MNNAIKFRPSLSAAQIQYILDIFDAGPTVHTDSKMCDSVIRSLKVFKLKADHGIVTPSHVATGRASLESSLGFSENPDSIGDLLVIWSTNPKSLSPNQINMVQKHRYVNDLMTPEEEAEYEQSQ